MNRLSQDRRALEARIRSIKAQLRSTWTEPMATVQRSLIACKREATELCILRAHLRGKQHLPDADLCKEVAQRRMPDYRKEEAGRTPSGGHHVRTQSTSPGASEASGAAESGRGGKQG